MEQETQFCVGTFIFQNDTKFSGASNAPIGHSTLQNERLLTIAPMRMIANIVNLTPVATVKVLIPTVMRFGMVT